MTRALTTLAVLAALVVAVWATPVLAHSLGVDQAELIERPDGSYLLVAKVPRALGHLITAPRLPDRCALTGSPRGQQGLAEKRFEFTCETPLTARDTLSLPWRREGTLLAVRWADGSSASHLVSRQGATIDIDLARFQAGSGSWLEAAQRYLALGVEHILLGFDHLLFVFGLLLLVRNGWMLVKTVTAFTIAHSITLGLATLGFVEAPIRPVEAAIALSIVFVGVEVLRARQGRLGLAARHPWVVAFAFGLLHGFGFAGALSEIGLPPSEIPIALLFFNIGVELGQLAFVAAVIGLWWSVRRLRFRWPEWSGAIPGYAVGTLATFWFIERALLVLPV